MSISVWQYEAGTLDSIITAGLIPANDPLLIFG
jgi:hypothetical protein